jgi:hypothetical protein
LAENSAPGKTDQKKAPNEDDNGARAFLTRAQVLALSKDCINPIAHGSALLPPKYPETRCSSCPPRSAALAKAPILELLRFQDHAQIERGVMTQSSTCI